MTDLPTVDGGFEIVFADPPWRFSGNSAAKPGRNAIAHYPCMTIPQLCAMPVREAVAELRRDGIIQNIRFDRPRRCG